MRARGAATPPGVVLPIIDLVARHFNTTPKEILGPRTLARAARARAVAMVLTAELCCWDDPTIGRAFNRDRRTVFGARRAVNARIDRDVNFAMQIASLELQLHPLIQARRQADTIINQALAQVTRSLISEALHDPASAAVRASQLMESYA